MTLKEKLLLDMRTAMKQRDSFRKSVLTMVRAAVLQIEKDKRTELDDRGVIEVIAKEVKSRKEALKMFKQGGRQDLVDKNEKEIEILSEYLPPQLSEDEIRAAIKKAIERTGAESMKDMGKVMSAVMPDLKGSADGGTVNRLVKELLQ
ncbi:MAG: GatB/YqeY domain-containing protein [Clostridia bacterium]|jgi:uncharacterized protein YqeY|nr:GatB/YqeY domain-containing protein [Clostridiales bacterium]